MKVSDFNTDKGLYIFKLNDFETAFHSHPAIEIIIANEGNFSISTPDFTTSNLKFAVVDSNVSHKLSATHCDLQIIMIEHHNKLTKRILSDNKINIVNGLFYNEREQNYSEVLNHLIQIIATHENSNEYDKRIKKSITYIGKHQTEDELTIKTLQEVVNLSESRLSHLFKENVGISLKKYLVWHRLKVTITLLLKNKEDLFTSLINSGFYDQPHFSKAFKTMLGVRPSTVYNSRTLQV